MEEDGDISMAESETADLQTSHTSTPMGTPSSSRSKVRTVKFSEMFQFTFCSCHSITKAKTSSRLTDVKCYESQ